MGTQVPGGIPRARDGEIRDAAAPRPVVETSIVHAGVIFDLRSDVVDLGAAGQFRRDYIDHPGAVAVIALDDDESVLLLRQYRHPVRSLLWEPPAGLLDIDHEDACVAAQRELAEETGLVAAQWNVLADFYTTPGGSNEAIRIFLARGITPVGDDFHFTPEAEETDMELRWVPLDDAVDAVLGGAVHNPSTVVGLLAAAQARARGWQTLRPADAPWPQRRAATSTS